MKKVILSFITLLLTVVAVQAQFIHGPGFLQDRDIFGTRTFVENRGQFDRRLNSKEKIYYALDNGSERIYFTGKGLVYELTKVTPLKEWQKEQLEKGEATDFKTEEKKYVNMNWINANPDLVIENAEPQHHYFTYGGPELNSYAFKKIIYKNVYNHIDIEYTIPSDKTQGVKYSVILHPGANAGDVKITYSGDVTKIKLDKAGNIIIKTPFEDLAEHTPKSFYADKEVIASEFTLKENVIGFNFPSGTQKGRTLIIDPWVSAVTTLTTNNYGYDVDYDALGNLYAFGGSSPAKMAKYSTTGALLWTFSGVLATPSWSTSGQGSYISNFVVIKTNGKTYYGEALNGSGTRIIRLDAVGNYDNLISTPVATWREVWDMAYHCSTGNVYGMGGSTGSKQSAGILNQTTGSLTPIAFLAQGTSAHDIVCHAIDDSGELFWQYASAGGASVLNNQLARINSAFTSSVWLAPSTFTTMNEAANKNAYVGGNVSSNGFNSLAVNGNFLYYWDGFNMAAYNKTNGSIVASSNVPGYIVKRQGGIAVDDCDNLYLGGNGSILCYRFNGTNFIPLTPIPLGVTSSTNQYVCDIRMDKLNKTLYVSGSGFVGTYVAASSSTCGVSSIICTNSQPIDYITCAGISVSLTPANYANLTNVSYSIQPGSLSNTTGTFVITPTVTTTYTTYVTGTTISSAVVTLTSVSTVTVNPQPLTAPTATQTTCTGTINALNLGLTFNPPSASPGYTITWSTIPFGVFSFTQTNSTGGIIPGVYTATVNTSAGCTSINSVTIAPQPEPAVFIIDPSTGNYEINCYLPSVNLTFTPASYNYTSTNGVSLPLTGPYVAFTPTNSFGTWTVYAVNPVSGCTSNKTFVIATNTAIPSSTLTPLLQNITCSVTSVINVTAVANPSINISHQWMAPQGGTLTAFTATSTFLPLSPGLYVHCLVNTTNGCSTCKTFTVSSTSGFPTFSVSSPQSFTLGCGTKSVATINISGGATAPIAGGPVSYALIGPPTSTNYVTGGISTYTVNVPGTWTVITKDNTNLCETKVQVSVLQNTFAPDISAIVPYQVLTCDQPSVIIQGISTTPNVDFNWSFPGVPGNFPSSTVAINANFANTSNTLVANYTLTIMDNSSTCKSTTVVTMLQNIIPPNALISGGTQLTCATPSINFTNSSSTRIPTFFSPTAPVIGYMWTGPSPQRPLQVSSTYIGWVPGTYTMVAKDLNNGCTAVATRSLDDFRDYPIVNNPDLPPASVLDCGAKTATLIPTISTSTAGLTYTWTGPPTASLSDQHAMIQYPNVLGEYKLVVYNPANGCMSETYMYVTGGALNAKIETDIATGYAPLSVTFSNQTTSTTGKAGITTFWSFGNGTSSVTASASISPVAKYTSPGKYTIVMYSSKGECIDSTLSYVQVEIPSELTIPNIFSPNNDNVNDVFFVKAANLTEISIIIVDRWGQKVYELTSASGNISWDGKTQLGKDAAEGVYSYVLSAKGKDGTDFTKNGTITLVR
ncbi:MAG: gliding motility-associated C-terminal domain-containing protein [bacterium]|nr:gliding motility-associated C-terminal domain-containing protein [bacterium]